MRVLVVDDDPLNRTIATGFLRIGGHQVVCVESGAAAVEAASTADFNVILMDVRMPGMSGPEATQRIRALPPPRGAVRVVAVTAQAFAQQIEICRQAGMNSHLSKPFTQSMLFAALVESKSGGSASTLWPPEAPAQFTEVEFPTFDRATFEDVTWTLSVAEVDEHLRTLSARCERLLLDLRNPLMLVEAGRLIEDAHKVAGGAGTFGFLSVAAAARQYEVATDATVAAGHLAAAIEAAIETMNEQVDAYGGQKVTDRPQSVSHG